MSAGSASKRSCFITVSKGKLVTWLPGTMMYLAARCRPRIRFSDGVENSAASSILRSSWV